MQIHSVSSKMPYELITKIIDTVDHEIISAFCLLQFFFAG